MTEDEILHSGDRMACAILYAGRAIASSIHLLGTTDAASPMGAIEFLGATLGEKLDALANAISEVGEAISAQGED